MGHDVQFSFAFGFVLIVVMSAVFILSSVYRQRRPLKSSGLFASFPQWEFTPREIGGFSWFQLTLASALSLFLEMLLIRWVASEVPVFAYFKNVVLIGCFFGFGLGYYLCRRNINWLAFVLPLCLLVVLIKMPWSASRAAIEQIPYFIARTSDFELFGRPDKPAGLVASLSAIVLIALLFALVAFVLIPLGQIVGWLLESAENGIAAYTVNVLAGLGGIALYTALCFWWQPPAIWFALGGLMAALLLRKSPRLRWTSLLAFLLCVGFASLGPPHPSRELWSPYQKITLSPLPADNPIKYELRTNGSWYQEIINLSPDFVTIHPELFRIVPVEGNAYNLPYHFYPNPPSVLVLGAGTGNDVAAALRNGAGRVVAVEIDPLILEIGRSLHFERPYESPRVQTVADDARSYVQNSHDKFDMIVFSLLDSHTTASYYSNIRIDNYVYTLEAFQATKRLLKPDGVFIVKFWVTTPWIAGRLYRLVETVFGQPPADLYAVLSDYTSSGRFFIAGSQDRIQRAMSNPVVRAYSRGVQDTHAPTTILTTDDWPYLYQRARGIPPSLGMLSLVLLVLCWRLLRTVGADLASLRWHFFFLGAGFMLLESQIVSKMALLFGTTWFVNSIVVAGILVVIAAANMLFQYVPRISYASAYAGIFVSLAMDYLIPLERFFFSSFWLKALSASCVLCLPVFFAGMIFIRSFQDVNFEGKALGANLFGALFGGLLESLSLWTGIRSLVVFAAILYSASCLALMSKKSAAARPSYS